MANELLDALALYQMSGRECRVVLAVVRRTYGYSRPMAPISRSELAAACGLARRDADRVVRQLVAKKILLSVPGRGRRPALLGLQKDYDLWIARPVADLSVVSASEPTQRRAVSAKKPTQQGAKKPTQKKSYHIDKRNGERKRRGREPSEEALTVAQAYHRVVRERYGLRGKDPDRQDREGALVLDELVRIDGHDWEAVKDVLRWALLDDFWASNILSLASVRRTGKGGVSKFQTCLAQYVRARKTAQGIAAERPAAPSRTLTAEELQALPNCVGEL